MSAIIGWRLCCICDGEGKVFVESRKKKGKRLDACAECNGRGLQWQEREKIEEKIMPNQLDETHVLIVGGGLSGMALALALEQRGIAWILIERDESLVARRQGYGLTLQQGGIALRQLGVEVHGVSPVGNISLSAKDGSVLGAYARPETGKRARSCRRPANIVAPRQRVRSAIAQNLLQMTQDRIIWNCKFVGFCDDVDSKSDDLQIVSIIQNGQISQIRARLIVGADGARSSVRRTLEEYGQTACNKHEFLHLLVVLGICPAIAAPESLRGSTWQALDGDTRIYVMPFDGQSKDAPHASLEDYTDLDSMHQASPARIMWQLSWPFEGDEQAAQKALTSPDAVLRLCSKKLEKWRCSASQLIAATAPTDITAYPIISAQHIVPRPCPTRRVVLIGDARGAMTPFKGQGANQALLDSLSLARQLRRVSSSSWTFFFSQ
mmetsp:Transcript_10145/g.15348  ORF Transcript_10145/g.15348 Transcript_10145/m.15348 type:complete len:437 (-) Transcript_10145:1151-2461(-)